MAKETYRSEIVRLRAELAVRSAPDVRDWSRPTEFCGHGLSSAYDSGYERGYRGHTLRNCYIRSHQRKAYMAGWGDGQRAAGEAIAAIVIGGLK